MRRVKPADEAREGDEPRLRLGVACARAGILRAGLLVALACLAGHRCLAAEHLTLRNGFELLCDHRAEAPAAAAGTVRLFLDAGETNYVDVLPGEIVSAEDVPETSMGALTSPEYAPEPSAGAPETSPTQTSPTLDLAPASSQGLRRAAAKGSPGPTGTQALTNLALSSGELNQLLAGAGTEHDLDVDLLAAVVHAESGSRTRAVSRTGAQGLMQLMPGTAAELGVKDSFAPEANVHGGTAYLDGLLKRYHDNLSLALAAYNAGPGAVDRYNGVPPYRETRLYVARIIHEFNQRYTARQAAASLAAMH